MDPESQESLINGAKSILEFLDRNADFRDIYSAAEVAIGFCGLYSNDDVLGRLCRYSNPDACNGDNDAFIPVVIRFMGEMMSYLTRCLIVYLIIAIIVFIFIIPTLKSSSESQEKKIQMMPLPSDMNSQRAPLVVTNAPAQSNMFVPIQQNAQSPYVVKPVSEGVFPAIPVTGHVTAQ